MRTMSGTEAPSSPFEPFQGADTAGGSQTDADTEQDCGGPRHQRKQGGWPGYESGHQAGDKRRKWGAYGVHEPEATAHKIARQDEANGTGTQANE
jgi:hypothetical protein